MLASSSFYRMMQNAFIDGWNVSIDDNDLVIIQSIIIMFVIIIAIILYCNHRIKKRIIDDRDYLEQMINTISTPIFIIDDKHDLFTVNNAACTVFKKDRQDLIGKPCSCIHSVNCFTSQCAIEKLIHEDIDQTSMELNGRQYIVTTTYMKKLKTTNHSGFIEVMQDVTDLMNMQKTLEERTLELETISHNLSCGILLTTLEKGFPIIQCNQGYLDLVGLDEKDVIHELAIQWVSPQEAMMTEAMIHEQLEKNQEVRLEHQLMRKDGTSIWVSLYGKQNVLHGRCIGIWMLVNIDERKRTEEQLIMNEERYRIAAQSNENIIVDYDVEKQVLILSDKAFEVYGLNGMMRLQEIVDSGIIAYESIATFLEAFEDLSSGKQEAIYEIITIAKKDTLWVRLTITPIFNKEGNVIRAIGIWHDFTKEKNLQLEYQREAQYRKITMEDMALYYEVNLTHHIFVTGYEELVDNYASSMTNDFDVVVDLMIQYVVYVEDRDLVKSYINWSYLMDAYEEGKTKIAFEYRRMISHTTCGWVACTIYLFRDEISHDIKALGNIRDIDESKKLELSLKQQAERDLLTGLFNKITTQRLIEDALHEYNGCICALMIVDLDDFKQVNDTMGHVFGDAVLSEVSTNLNSLFHGNNIIGRIGGDEFIVFIYDINCYDKINEMAASICDMFHKADSIVSITRKLSVSVGVACSPDDGTTFRDLYRKADIALYDSKNNGKDKYSLYDDAIPKTGSDNN